MSGDLEAAERALQAAISDADAQALERLLDDGFVHVGPDGTPQDKRGIIGAREDLAISAMDQRALDVTVAGETGVTRVTVAIHGRADGVPFSSTIVCTRTWILRDGAWRVLAEHASLADVPGRIVSRTIPDGSLN
jgi:ketosteroid isomerase-like protein